MAPKSRQSVTPSPGKPSAQAARPSPQSAPATRSSATSAKASTAALPDVARQLWADYGDKTPQRTKLLDAFLAYLAVLGAVQFVYCVLAGNYPFNAFLAGFGATVGQFVLTASLRVQTDPANAYEFPSISQERAFADYVLGSLILHFFCVNFVN